MNSKRIAVAFLLVFSIIAVGSSRRVRQAVEHQFGYEPVAIYGGLRFIGYDKFDVLYFESRSGDTSLSHVVIDDVPVRIMDVSRSSVAALFPDSKSGSARGDRDMFGDHYTRFVFKNGRLHSVRIDAITKGFKIGPSKDGPFVELPIDRKTMYELWGKPDRWERYRIRGI